MNKSVFVFVFIMLIGCSKGSDSQEEEETLPLNPSAPTLIYPNNNVIIQLKLRKGVLPLVKTVKIIRE